MARASLFDGLDFTSGSIEEPGYDRGFAAGAEPRTGFRVLLATAPASACRDAELAIAQLAGVGRVHVDVVHVLKPGGLTREIWQRLHDTLAGPTTATVDHYLVEDGDPAAAIARFCRHGDYDLIMAPAAARETVWLPWRRSLRAAILRRSAVPVWTTGASRPDSWSSRPVRHVGCYLSLETGADAHVRWAADFATRLGARLHLLHVVPPIDDGTIAEAFESDRPLLQDEAHARLQLLVAAGIDADTAVAVGACSREVVRLVRARTIDLLCLATHDALCGQQMSPGLRALPCPMVCCR